MAAMESSPRDSSTRYSSNLINPPSSKPTDIHNEPFHRPSHRVSSSMDSLRPEPPEPYDPLSAAKLAALASPCFFHRRINNAVNIEKVLEEIARDESMSHSRLVQTATGIREVSKQLQRRPMKRAVRTVMIVTKARDNGLVVLTRQLAEWLLRTPRYGSDVGVTVYVDEKLRAARRFDAPVLVAQEPRFASMLRYWTADMCWSSPEKFDLVLTLGGDGTVLFTSWLFQRIVPPVLSFSLGSLGFLTPFGFDSYREQLDAVMGGLNTQQRKLSSSVAISALSLDHSLATRSRSGTASSSTGASTPSSTDHIVPDAGMRVNLRMRFTCTVYRATRPTNPHGPVTYTESASSEVLNELVIDRGPSPYVSNLELYGDDDASTLLTVIQADGVIFSTPTGSTAYSLSAGGSLVHPDIPAILLTPICPHTLSFRPMLLNDTTALRVAVPRGSRATAWCSFDGKGRVELRPGDYVTISASRYPFPVVEGGRARGERWIDSVSRTLRWNTRGARQKAWGSGVEAHLGGNGGSGIGGGMSNSDVEKSHMLGLDKLDPSAAKFYDDDDDGGGAREAEVEEQFDIDFDEEDEGHDSKDSGYGGEASGGSSGGSGMAGTASPLRRAYPSLVAL